MSQQLALTTMKISGKIIETINIINSKLPENEKYLYLKRTYL
ncbi:hypothetical protein SVI_2729 [Shewanella violacea DSS12]|uniref:Uncharacterized protein n=1 Tax=Shewanella violacea (strain JCM 10179 / CIP 106290 / LMG 19151 / DSS12) TaxID=637905 RepID=D4ZM01_SHEVD|nr:hypothetical protein SVI_2729 [Shewanella violacea DSS12]